MKQKLIVEVATSLISFLLRFYHSTSRYIIVHEDRYLPLADKPYAFALWHQNIFKGISYFIYKTHITMASQSKDGEIAARACIKANKIPARGSSSKGGRAALNEMIDYIITEKVPAALTVDGPRGPLYDVKKGIIDIAAETGAPLIPLMVKAKDYCVFEKAWDKFRFPKPFTQIYVSYGDPIYVEKTEDYVEKYSTIVKESLFALEKELDEQYLS